MATLTNKDYCDYDTCVALKELGCPMIKEGYLGISLYSAQKWLRKVKKIEVNATYDNIVELHWHWYMKSLTNRNQTISMINHDSYESALLEAINAAVKILKEECYGKGSNTCQ